MGCRNVGTQVAMSTLSRLNRTSCLFSHRFSMQLMVLKRQLRGLLMYERVQPAVRMHHEIPAERSQLQR